MTNPKFWFIVLNEIVTDCTHKYLQNVLRKKTQQYLLSKKKKIWMNSARVPLLCTQRFTTIINYICWMVKVHYIIISPFEDIFVFVYFFSFVCSTVMWLSCFSFPNLMTVDYGHCVIYYYYSSPGYFVTFSVTTFTPVKSTNSQVHSNQCKTKKWLLSWDTR